MIRISQFILSKLPVGKTFLMLLLFPIVTFSQQTKDQRKEFRAAQNHLSEAQQSLQKEKFAEAEADYRQAISLNPKNEVAKYNLGTAYYEKEKNAEAMLRFHQAATTATTKAEKHNAFHNLGNTFMNAKKYQEAVAAYKDALRNNPHDDETRYNLALAKDMLEKNPPPPEDNDEDNQDQDKEENEKDQQNQDNQEDKEGDSEDRQEDNQEGNEDKGEPNQPLEEDGEQPQQQQPVPGQLSPQQVKSLLEAMNNEEKKVQEKINAEKQKGVKVKSDKDW